MARNLIENREIRIFISSTFSDMQDERNYLITRTFPILRKEAAERNVTLTELDLRWGITPEESRTGKVVEICLEEIENCIPFFIGILGNRYGYRPSAKDIHDTHVKERFPWVYRDIQSGLSITEMEMQFAVLRRKEDMNASFYIRIPEDFSVEQECPDSLAKLKKAVRENGRYPVFEYDTPESLALQVEERFSILLDSLFPVRIMSKLSKVRLEQRSFLCKLSQSYIRVEKSFDVLDAFLEDKDLHYLVVTGESGLGKSALIANWVKEKEQQVSYPVICHFIGNGGNVGSHNQVIETLCLELKDRFHLETPSDNAEKKTWDKNDSETLETVYHQIAGDQHRCLIVLDAVNQLLDQDQAKQMLWLGFPPKNVKVIFTTLEDDPTMVPFKKWEYPVFRLQPLEKEDRRKLVAEYLGLFGKKLTAGQTDRIILDPQSVNTLVLRTLLDELVSFGSYENLDRRIDYYLEPDSIGEFYQRVLEHFEEEFGEENVKSIMSLVSLSRNGFCEGDLIAITGLSPLHWSQLYCNILPHINIKAGLINFSHRYFAEAVYARYISGKTDYERSIHTNIVEYYKPRETEFSWSELAFQYDKLDDNESLYRLLLKPDRFIYFFRQETTSLTTWWNKLLDDKSNLFLLDDYLRISTNDEKEAYLFYMFLSRFTGENCVNPSLSLVFAERALTYVDEADKARRAEALDRIGLSLSLKGFNYKALKYLEDALHIRISLSGEKNSEVADSYNNVGHILLDLGLCEEGLKYCKKALRIRLLLFGENHPDVAESYNNIACAYGANRNYSLAIKYMKKALATLLVFGEHHPRVALAYENMGVALSYTNHSQDNLPKVIELFDKSLQLRLALFGTMHPDVAYSYDNIGMTYAMYNDHAKAVENMEKALHIRQALFEETHPKVIKTYKHLEREYLSLGNYEKAKECKAAQHPNDVTEAFLQSWHESN